MRRLRWMNIPIPVQHLVGLLLGAYLQIRFPQKLFSLLWLGAIIGWSLIAIGVWISLKATLEASEITIESPTLLLTTGPYARSRNPMYVGWALLHLGIAFSTNSLWIIAFLPPAIIFTHLVDIRIEERRLMAEFGDQYREYQEKVRRYI